MPYNEDLAERVTAAMESSTPPDARKMFGGIAFMVQGNMACGVIADDLIVRVPPDQYEATLARPHVRPMDMTGRPMRGWVVVGPEATSGEAALREWVSVGVDYALSLPPK